MLSNVLSHTTKLASEALERDTILLLHHEPLYAFLQEESRVVFTRSIDVAAVSMENRDFVLYINPEGYLAYTKNERMFILKHEWTHWIDEHPLESVHYNRKIWNLACDISINYDIETDECHRPKDAQVPEMYKLERGLSPRQYYVQLMEQYEKNQLNIDKSLSSIAMGDKLKNNEPEKEEPKTIHGHLTKLKKLTDTTFLVRVGLKMAVFTKEDSFYDENLTAISFEDLVEGLYAEALVIPKDGGYIGLHLKLIEEPSEEDSSSNNGNEPSPSSETGDTGSSQSNDVTPEDLEGLHPNWEQTNTSSPSLQQESLRQKIQDAVEHAGDQAPEHLQARIAKQTKTSTDWSILRHFIGTKKGQNKTYTYRKRNRRIPFAPGVKKKVHLKIVAILDTSASVTEEQLAAFDAELRRIYRMHSTIQIIVIICDVKIRDVFEYKRSSLHESITFSGRGGTDFRPPFELIEKRGHPLLREAPNAVLYLTDGGGIAPTSFHIPTLWCLTANGHLPYVNKFGSDEFVSWGQVIQLKE